MQKFSPEKTKFKMRLDNNKLESQNKSYGLRKTQVI